jgi:phosphatidylglycerol:prolipoprotein diacylglycerol transferase
MFVNNINPILFNLGPFQVRYYGLFYAIGFLASYFLVKYLLKKDSNNPLNADDVDDFYLYLMIGGLGGSKLFYVLVYQFQNFLANPRIMLSGSGMSAHGALLGGMLALLLFTFRYNKKHEKNITLYHITDILAIPMAFSFALGRIGNFTNHELYGRITNVPWAVQFRSAPGFRHPSQLYESFYSLLIGGIQWFFFTKKLPRGFMTWSFFVLYGVFRFITEFFRQPDPQMGSNGFILGWMSTGQLLSILMILCGGIMLFRIYRKEIRKYE